MNENQSQKKWYMLTIVGIDQVGIVAEITQSLYQGGCNLGEASMIRLGGNFTIMLMVESAKDAPDLESLVTPVAEKLGLHMNIDPIQGKLHQNIAPDVQITVFGADRAGIVAQVTNVLAAAGLNILDLKSTVAGTVDKPIYVMHFEGQARQGIEALERALKAESISGLEVTISPLETMIG